MSIKYAINAIAFILGLGLLILLWYAHGRQKEREKQKTLQAGAADHAGDAAPGQPSPEGAADMADSAADAAQQRPAPVFALDPLLDAMAYIHLPAHMQLPGARLDGAALPHSGWLDSKPFMLEGFNSHSQQWEPVQPEADYVQFRLGVQMANQTGPITQTEYTAFARHAYAMAHHMGVPEDAVELPELPAVQEHGSELDTFANEHDVQLHFTIHAHGRLWSVAEVLGHAQQQGFVLSSQPGLLELWITEPAELVLMTLQFNPQAAQASDPNQALVDRFQLNMALSHIPVEVNPVWNFYAVALAMSRQMGGLVQNEEGVPASDETLRSLASTLDRLYDQLEQAGFAAGSPLLQRLLS